MLRPLAVSLTLAAIVAGVAYGAVAAGNGPLPSEWREVRAATARYHSVDQALADGYSLEGEPCVSSPFGTMGFHAVNLGLVFDPAIDPLRPEVLLYVPGDDGSLKLVAVEYFKADVDGDLGTTGDRPSIFGIPFEGPMAGHSPVMPAHYDLHVWVHERNPNGLVQSFNPAISC